MEILINQNIKFLRKRKHLTQEMLADVLGMKRSTLSGYENLVAMPGIEELLIFSGYFNIAVDTLLKVNLSKISEKQMREIERGFDPFIKGTQLRVLSTTVDRRNRENIELVPEKAKAGYAGGFADPEFIRDLPVFTLPFLSDQKKYRTFQINGDSMLPIPDKAWVTGEYIQDWSHLPNNTLAIVITRNEGVVFKKIKNQLSVNQSITLLSLNPVYEPYEVNANDICEIWKFVLYFTSEIPQVPATRDELAEAVNLLRNDMEKIKNQFNIT